MGVCLKLYLVHCGFYDSSVCDGLYESHANYFLVATSVEEARLKAKQLPEYQARRMHIDGVQEIQSVDGYDVQLQLNSALAGKTVVINTKHRELAPVKPASEVRI
jgi:hypothetical protein